MSRKPQVTAAVRALRAESIAYREHHYDYGAGHGAAGGADQLGFELHRIIKTLIMVTSADQPLCVLMHGDREVSLKGLARHLGVKSIAMAEPEAARRFTGYEFGGTSPFGLRSKMPVYCEESILAFDEILINGGKRGFLIEVATADLVKTLSPSFVQVAI